MIKLTNENYRDVLAAACEGRLISERGRQAQPHNFWLVLPGSSPEYDLTTTVRLTEAALQANEYEWITRSERITGPDEVARWDRYVLTESGRKMLAAVTTVLDGIRG